MSNIVPITEELYWIGVNDYETALFESIWPLPRGVSYNSYLLVDEKTVMIDAVKKGFLTGLLDKAKGVLGDKTIDYLVVNHMEPDHSGAIKVLRRIYPNMTIVGNAKTVRFLERFYGITENIHVAEDGDVLELGKHKLKFFLTPMVHWPETMMTYEPTLKALFSGDAFGGFGALPDGIFDDEVDLDYYEDEILRYFSNIVGKYSAMVQKAIAKLGDLEIKLVASTHGPIWRTNPGKIIEDYAKWSSHQTEEGIVIAYASMYGNTQKMTEVVARAIAEAGVEKVRVHNLSRTHVSYVIRDIWRYKGLILGSPTYNTKVFPLMQTLLEHLENKKLKNHRVGIVGTYGWSKGAVARMMKLAESPGWEIVEPIVEANCSPDDQEEADCAELGKNMAAAIREE
ncbi:MAG: FprA family A-type flavoprotein [Phycisphaerae bacterium]